MTEFVVRRAVAADGDGIGWVHVRGWHEAYTGRIPQRILDDLDFERYARGWSRALAEEPPGGNAIWVAEREGRIIGFASSGESRDADPVASRELYAIYVLAAHYGSGAGQALLDAALGTSAASLWVLDDNPRARAFYARNGFAPDGAVKDDDRWGDPLHEVRLVRGAQS